jgi:hypothetical protein
MARSCYKVVAVLALAIWVAAGVGLFADAPKRLEIIFQGVEGSTLRVGVHNPEHFAQAGQVVAVVTVSGTTITKTKSVQVPPHTTRTVTFTFDGSVRVVSVSVVTQPSTSGNGSNGPGGDDLLQDESITEGPDPIEN